jgi:hypothetical protein
LVRHVLLDILGATSIREPRRIHAALGRHSSIPENGVTNARSNSEGIDRTSVLIPKDAIVTVVHGPLNGNRMVDVKWENFTIMIFVEDLRELGTLIPSE